MFYSVIELSLEHEHSIECICSRVIPICIDLKVCLAIISSATMTETQLRPACPLPGFFQGHILE